MPLQDRLCSLGGNVMKLYYVRFNMLYIIIHKHTHTHTHTGTSLGGNVMTKLLGELGEGASDVGIYGGAVACVPMNALQCQPTLDNNAFNRKVDSG